jgi:mono/diheme cytochrome c family protein
MSADWRRVMDRRLLHRLTLATMLSLALPGGITVALADEASTGPSANATAVDVKKVFATNCSWCHDGYGMDAGKGPKLAGTQMTEKQIYDRIWNGKPGAMPAYKNALTDAQAQALASYIKALPAN